MIFCFITQIHREFRKPLIVMAPKNLLRHKDCKSNLSEFDDVQGHPGFDKQGTRFKRLIKDQNNHSDLEEGIRRLVLCSGKVVLLIAAFHLFIGFWIWEGWSCGGRGEESRAEDGPN